MSGSGNVGSTIRRNGSGGYATRGDSFFDVFFTVDVAGDYDFSATASWSGPTPVFGSFTNPDNYAIVELRNATSNSQLVVAYRDFLTQGTDGARHIDVEPGRQRSSHCPVAREGSRRRERHLQREFELVF